MKKHNLVGLLFVALISLSALGQETKVWSLKECVDYTLENNIRVKQTTLDVSTADENLITAKGNFMPNLAGSATQSYNFGSFIDQDQRRISTDARGNTFGLNTGVILFNGFQNTSTYKQAKLGIESSKLQLAILKDNISLNVVNQYLSVLLNKENLKVANEQILVTQKRLEQIKELVASGVRPKADLFDVQAQLASDQEQLTNVRNNVDLALLSLAQLLQISHRGFDVEDMEMQLPAVLLEHKSADDIYDYALTSRPEIRQAELNIEDSELGVDIAKSAYYPTLSFGAGMFTSYQHQQGQDDVRPIIDPDNPPNIIFIPNGFGKQLSDNLGYNFGFNLSVPIFNRLQTKANVNRARINNERIAYALEQEKQDLRTNIEQAYADAKAAFNQFEASKVSLEAQKEAFKNAEESYNLGVMNAFEFEQVRNRLINAESNLINSKYNFVFKTKVLDFYLGKPLIN
ncbi:TolC family protein [Algibacter mikhailovii]|uniref:Transporter n=1 Tax=Algibacter mikhailovii TaxID=425498 RepID=A0A918QWH9_9FLAO|nr:TolC family protein [Algibacter mikhailovii]GGZ74015.1 transporter [Algibacter mikhailovii]